MFRNILNYLYSNVSGSVPAILSGILDHFRDRQIHDFVSKHESIVWELPQAWRGMKPTELASLLQQYPPTDQLLILELASFHRSGYVRQKAVELLNQIENGNELRCLLIRLNDWVDNVASAASVAVTNRVVVAYCQAFVRELPFVLHLNDTGRRNNRQVLQRILELLASLELQSLLLAIRESHSQAVLRQFFKICMQLEIAGSAALVRVGLADGDAYIRGKCMHYVAQHFSSNERLEIAAEHCGDASDAVRRNSLMIIAESETVAACEELQRALFDPNAGVRDIAQFNLRKANRDVAEVYRQELQHQPESLIALRGLAETGGSLDEQLFLHYAQHRLPSRRLAALRGLSLLNGESLDELFVKKLSDPSPRVVRFAERIIRDQGRVVQGQQLLELYLATTNIASRTALVTLFDQLGKWQAIHWLMRLLAVAPAEDKAEIEAAIAAWFLPPRDNTVFVKPFAHEIEELSQAFSPIANHLTGFIKQEMFKVLRD